MRDLRLRRGGRDDRPQSANREASDDGARRRPLSRSCQSMAMIMRTIIATSTSRPRPRRTAENLPRDGRARDAHPGQERRARGRRIARGSRAAEILALNLVSAPGAGKTTLLERTIRDLKGELPLFVLEGDQATANDAERIRAAGAPVVQINTGSGCHLEADMVARGVAELKPAPGSVRPDRERRQPRLPGALRPRRARQGRRSSRSPKARTSRSNIRTCSARRK